MAWCRHRAALRVRCAASAAGRDGRHGWPSVSRSGYAGRAAPGSCPTPEAVRRVPDASGDTLTRSAAHEHRRVRLLVVGGGTGATPGPRRVPGPGLDVPLRVGAVDMDTAHHG